MKKYFITGLVTLLPLAVTVWVVRFVVNFLTRPFAGIAEAITKRLPPGSQYYVQLSSQILILIALFLFILLLGLIARRWFFGNLIRLGDKLLIAIPFVSKIYYTSKEITKALFGSKEKSFTQVVILPFPNPHCYCLGLVAKAAPATCSQVEGTELISVFIPTTPNPTTGFLVMTEKKDLIYLKMKTEEAIKYVVSCGVIQPEDVR